MTTEDVETAYKSTYEKNGDSSQACSAWAPIYMEDAEGAPDERFTEMYWKMKN